MKITVVYPQSAHSAYKIAAESFSALALKVSGDECNIVTDEQYQAESAPSDLVVVIGNDSANSLYAGLFVSRLADSFNIRYGKDDYCIRTANIDSTNYLFLAGGRPRATI